MVKNRLPADGPGGDAQDGPLKVNEVLAKAAAQALTEKAQAFMAAVSRSARLYLVALREMGGASIQADELRELGLRIESSPFGTTESLAEQYRSIAHSAVANGLIAPTDPLVADVVSSGGPPTS
jgi:hypothetical protein